MNNDDTAPGKSKCWQLTVKGTKFAPRHKEIIKAEEIYRNKFGDLIFMDGKTVVASYNREAIIGVCFESHVAKPKKQNKGTTILHEGE